VLEHYMRACHLDHQLDYLTVRIFNAYGPRLRGRVLDRFIDAALRDQPLRVHGDGSQTRCFTYVDDLVDGIVRLLACPKAHNTVYNVGNPQEVSILDLAQRILDMTGSNAPIEFVTHEQELGAAYEDIQRRVPDVSRIREAIGWQPTTPLELGLTRHLAYRSKELGLVHA
jgi:nucleoside-diphosphate-sugar epimerase